MRLVPYDELTLLSPEVPDARKYIHVDTATQSVTAFEDEQGRAGRTLLQRRQRHQDPAGRVPDLSQGPVHPHDQ